MTPEDRILDHFANPYHRDTPWEGLFTVCEGTHTNDTCGDSIQIKVWYDNTPQKRITNLWWDGHGCCYSQAMASMLAEHCEARRMEEVKAFKKDDMLDLFQLDVELNRVDCVMVSFNALQKALENE